jgi:hypothetical protein
VAWGARRTQRLSGTLEQVPDVVVQLIGNTRSGHLSERPAGLTLESVDAANKTKINSIPAFSAARREVTADPVRDRC